ncbi:MAG: hypothetical protein QCI82_09265, partial [Candidatus Thermoplasmatota archaeon]|nr:hypothetical protein [Candidatus Thermoplasmatota archaeon]
VVQDLPRNHYQMLFTVRMYDYDYLKSHDMIDISPCDTYTLEVFYDVITGMWAVWEDMDKIKSDYYDYDYLSSWYNLVEGSFVYQSNDNNYSVIKETYKGNPVNHYNFDDGIVRDGIGYVTGYNKDKRSLDNVGGVQFEIAPYHGGNEELDYYSDYDHDGMTSISEIFWSDTNNHFWDPYGKKYQYGILNPNEWDSDGDMLGDGWEMRYGFDPCDENDPGNDRDGDNDGIKDIYEYYLPFNIEEKVYDMGNGRLTYYTVHKMSIWGAQPDRADIFVEVDWFRETINEYDIFYSPIKIGVKISFSLPNNVKDNLAIAFFAACRYDVYISLHIDDGALGEGGDIGDYFYLEVFGDNYIDNLYLSKGLRGDKDKNYEGNNGFNYLRRSIFRYLIIMDILPSIVNIGEIDGWTGSGKIYWTPSDTYHLSSCFYIARRYLETTEDWCHIIMHELGHNLLGILNEEYHSKSMNQYSFLHSCWPDDVMYEDPNNSSWAKQGKGSESKYWNYRPELWIEMKNEGYGNNLNFWRKNSYFIETYKIEEE